MSVDSGVFCRYREMFNIVQNVTYVKVDKLLNTIAVMQACMWHFQPSNGLRLISNMSTALYHLVYVSKQESY